MEGDYDADLEWQGSTSCLDWGMEPSGSSEIEIDHGDTFTFGFGDDQEAWDCALAGQDFTCSGSGEDPISGYDFRGPW